MHTTTDWVELGASTLTTAAYFRVLTKNFVLQHNPRLKGYDSYLCAT